MKYLLVVAGMSMPMATPVFAQQVADGTVVGQQCDDVGATPSTDDDCCDDDGSTTSLDDDCPLVVPPLDATNLAFIAPIAAVGLLVAIAGGGGGGGTSDTQ